MRHLLSYGILQHSLLKSVIAGTGSLVWKVKQQNLYGVLNGSDGQTSAGVCPTSAEGMAAKSYLSRWKLLLIRIPRTTQEENLQQKLSSSVPANPRSFIFLTGIWENDAASGCASTCVTLRANCALVEVTTEVCPLVFRHYRRSHTNAS